MVEGPCNPSTQEGEHETHEFEASIVAGLGLLIK